MSLYADGKHEILLLCAVQSILDMCQQNIILCPAIFRKLKHIHELFTCKTVKSNIIKYLRTAVEIPAIVMDGMCTIPKRSKCRCRTFCNPIFQYRFVRVFSGSEISQAHSGKHFKLRVRCSGSYGWNLEISGRIFLKHFS